MAVIIPWRGSSRSFAANVAGVLPSMFRSYHLASRWWFNGSWLVIRRQGDDRRKCPVQDRRNLWALRVGICRGTEVLQRPGVASPGMYANWSVPVRLVALMLAFAQ
jgi:hypothetical protein